MMSTSRGDGIQNTNEIIKQILATSTLPKITFSHDFLEFKPAPLNDQLAELYRTPKRIHLNPAQKNETHSAISRITNVVWLDIFSYLDIPSLVSMMISCKKMGTLANDNNVRERLYKAKQYHLFAKRSFSFIDETPELTIASLSNDLILRPQITITEESKGTGVYNDNPPGQGFVTVPKKSL